MNLITGPRDPVLSASAEAYEEVCDHCTINYLGKYNSDRDVTLTSTPQITNQNQQENCNIGVSFKIF